MHSLICPRLRKLYDKGVYKSKMRKCFINSHEYSQHNFYNYNKIRNIITSTLHIIQRLTLNVFKLPVIKMVISPKWHLNGPMNVYN